MKKHLLFIDGKNVDSKSTTDVLNPFNEKKVAETSLASSEQMEQAISAAHDAFQVFKKSSSFVRSKLLTLMAQEISQRRKDLVETIVNEAGKPRMLADIEVSRAIMTFTIASEEAKRFGGEVIPVDLDAAGRAFSPAVSTWEPRGPVLAIGPFNFPLNLIAHKVAPALAVGATVIVKPPPQAPGAAGILAEIFAKSAASVSDAREKIPLSVLQVVNAPNEVISKAVTDPRMGILSFTGSDKVGWMLQTQAVRKKVCLELGGNAAVIVHSDADLKRAATRCAFGAFAYAGQICISVQRIFIHHDVFSKFQELFLDEVKRIKVGDPALDDTIVGPLIDSGNATRVIQWIEEAQKSGAKILTGGTRSGNVVTPTVIVGAKHTNKVNCEEVFGPVVTLEEYTHIDKVIEAVNESRFGLQAGIFADSSQVISKVCSELDVGGVIVNEIPTYRADNMPYGGVKDSGLGREGIRYSMEDFSERKVVVTWKG